MALSKQLEFGKTGLMLGYWRLVAVNIDFVSNITIVKVAGYVDGASRLAGNAPIDYKTIRWVGSDNPITPQLMMAGQAFTAAYTKLTAPETRPMMPANPFEGAELV